MRRRDETRNSLDPQSRSTMISSRSTMRGTVIDCEAQVNTTVRKSSNRHAPISSVRSIHGIESVRSVREVGRHGISTTNRSCSCQKSTERKASQLLAVKTRSSAKRADSSRERGYPNTSMAGSPWSRGRPNSVTHPSIGRSSRRFSSPACRLPPLDPSRPIDL